MNEPITGPQLTYLARLIASVGKARYITAKTALGLGPITLTRLSKWEASALIQSLKKQVGDD